MTVYFKSFFPLDTPLHEWNESVGLVLTEASLQRNLCEFELGPGLERSPRLLCFKLWGLNFASTFSIIFEWEGSGNSFTVRMIFDLDIVDRRTCFLFRFTGNTMLWSCLRDPIINLLASGMKKNVVSCMYLHPSSPHLKPMQLDHLQYQALYHERGQLKF